MGGIGKTALAVEAAHQARAKGWFPGGTLFVDLRGYDDNPVTADQAVLALLDALGVRDADLPERTERQYDAYRTLLTARHERMLLILDNASDPSQYLPLLPGTDQHRVLITSRDSPNALPIRIIDLEALVPDESVALVTCALHDADERDERPSRELDSLRELTALCGHLPLALQIAAAMLRQRRHRSISSLVAEIKEAEDPTIVLDNGSPGTDLYGRSLVLRPVLETSYRRLPPAQARLLRLLSLAPGSETTTEAVTALADLGTEAASLSLLENLAATHLVAPVQSGEGSASVLRWQLHDLVRAFAVSVVARDQGLRKEGETARERVLTFYYRWADAADDRLRWLPGAVEPERFTGRKEALEWLDGERAGLVAAVLWAREERFTDTAVRLAGCLAQYLDWRRYFDDLITTMRAAREATHRAGNVLGESMAWNNLGIALRKVGRRDEAIDAHTCDRDLCQAAKDRPGEADAWNNLGNAFLEADRVEEAINALTRARDLHQVTGNRQGEADAWNNLGSALKKADRTEEAIKGHTRARDLYRVTQDRHGEAVAWNNLGCALPNEEWEEAIEACSRALEIFQEFEDWYETGQTLHNLALAHEEAARTAEARAHHLRAADAFTRANAPDQAAQSRADAENLE
ncbi:tetratricopeptide repeat protein [Streptomyces capitiformicae]|nr:tetratricopeptide repeat protein [Streptomyces capitiformicae]